MMQSGNGKATSKFSKTLEVKLDQSTGSVIGWDDFFKQIEM
jgi:hypothetical protein